MMMNFLHSFAFIRVHLRPLVFSALCLAATSPGVQAATCDGEETRRCGTCEDGIDNDGNQRIDAEDPGCATLAYYQRAAVVITKPGEVESSQAQPAIGSVLLPGGLVGDPVDGRCAGEPTTSNHQPSTGNSSTCVCPPESPECQSAGRPCAGDGDCTAVPYPLGQSRAGVCAGPDAVNAPEIRCRPEGELVRIAQSIERIPGEEIEPIRVTRGSSPLVLSFGGGRHIVDVDTVALEAETEIVLAGEADTVIVVRVRGPLELGTQAAVTLEGELGADRLLWVLGGHEGRIVLGDRSRFVGTILAPERPPVEVGNEARISGAVLAADVTEASSLMVKWSNVESPNER